MQVVRKAWFPVAVAVLYLYNFSYFKGINSANELPRIYLTMALWDRGAVNIDQELKRYQPTPDVSGYKDKTYINKAPGMSLLCVPVYGVMKWLGDGQTPELRSMFFWFRIFASIVPALLFLLLLWRFLKLFVADEHHRRMALAAYALGTMALTYGTLLLAHQLSGLLTATGYILIHLYRRKQTSTRSLYLAGLAAGAGVLVDYQVAFIGPVLFLYLLWVARPRLRSAILFCAGAALPLIVLLIYQWACFDSPFKTGYHFVTNQQFKQWHSQGFLGMAAFNPVAFWGSFFRADNGLFYFSPFLLLAFPGLVLMWLKKSLRADAVLCLVLILFFAYFVSSLTFWRSGWAVGPRYITCALPFYLVPVAVLLASTGDRWYARIVCYGLMALSILLYVTANGVFPHYPENFSDPWFDVTLRFGRAGYLPYNLGWLLGLSGLASAIPYLAVLGLLLGALLLGGREPLRRRGLAALGALALVCCILGGYYQQLSHRRLPVPVKFLPWMERIWEPRHDDMDLEKLIPAGDPRTSGLKTRKG